MKVMGINWKKWEVMGARESIREGMREVIGGGGRERTRGEGRRFSK